MTTAHEVCEWLKANAVGRIVNVRPVKVTIGKKTYVGAFYGRVDIYIPTERAVTEKRVLAGEEHTEHLFYLIGDRPKMRKAHHCFQWESGLPLDDRVYAHTNEWYVCCHSSNDPKSQKPWKMFMLSEWKSHVYGYYKDHRIDTLERFEYQRAPMTVEYLTPAGEA